MNTVANRRYDDAAALVATGRNARANGAIYLAGFAIECLLKSELLRKYPFLSSAGSPAVLAVSDRPLWSLLYRSHDRDEILARLPEVMERLRRVDQMDSSRVLQSLKEIASHWTIFARYSPMTADVREATLFLDQVREIKSWLG